MKDTFWILIDSITDNDAYIGVFALITGFIFLSAIVGAHHVKRESKEWKKVRNKSFSGFLSRRVNESYTLFVSFISVFPLLGMFGTVMGLLGLDLTADNMNNIKENFFVALTSTAWGIIFSIVYKIIHACTANYIEEQIEISKKLTNDDV